MLPSRTTKVFMWCLLGLFTFCVGAQLIQTLSPVSYLPAFDSWQSGTLSYGLLFTLKLLLLALMGAVTWRLSKGKISPNNQIGTMLLSAGAIYFAFMLFRLGAGLTFWSDHSFIGKILPAFFHLVLGCWILLLGSFHWRSDEFPEVSHSNILVRWLSYPLMIAISLWLHLALLHGGVGLQVSTYLPVALAAGLISLLEHRYPARQEWKPDNQDVKNDLAFMVFVQVLLPKILAFLCAISVLKLLQANEVILRGWWPQELSPIAQAGLMILLADFLRYWLHRASHEWSPRLWRLHAVHHSPHKLYWVNVGRFHPIEKSLQFVCDALPFIFLGVTQEVLALYFIFYATNGFFQHCNIDLRLGWLNYVVSGPELHRWHHSWEAHESNKNYGNNLIIWDLFFGTFFLPKDRRVNQLGLRNRDYPLDFQRQMRAPFIPGLDQNDE